jgi:uncharacterized protein (DUF2236 family)
MSGYFPKSSMVVRVMSKRAVSLTYGQRALVVGATDPVLYLGTAQHTSHRETPWTRLSLTARLFEDVFLGDRATADRALAFTARKHASVVGTTAVDGGPHAPLGTPYDARRGDLMWRTAAFTLDSVEVMHDLLVRRLTDGEREDLLADFVDWAVLFGMPREAGPSSYAEFRTRMDERLVNGEAHVIDEARLLAGYLTGQKAPYPLPGPAVLGSGALSAVVVSSLPEPVKAMFGFGPSRRRDLVFGAISGASRVAHALPLLPRTPVLTGLSRGSYRDIGATERRRIRRGHVSMPGISDVPDPYGLGEAGVVLRQDG